MSMYESIVKKADDYYRLVSIAYIRQISKNKWRVYSKSGRNMGTFSSRKKAKERLRQIEYFKSIKKASKNKKENIIDLSDIEELSYSCVVRELRKKYDKEIVMDFLQCFKGVFDTLLLAADNDIHENSMRYAMALFATKHAVKLPVLKKAQVFGSDPQKMGKYLADIVKFILRRISEKSRPKSIHSLKNKFRSLNINELAEKQLPASSSMGQAITFVKNVLFNNEAPYIARTIQSLISHL